MIKGPEHAPDAPYPPFAEFHRNLDGRFCYLVLEGGEGTEVKMEEIFTSLPLKTGDIAEKRLYQDARHSRLFLVARLARGQGENIRKRILSATLPPDFALLFYRL